jgi:uncharacterized circularly permuted ATP-grasp superfamily protein
VQVRTVSGPQPVGVLWRRLDAAYADPLELEETSQIGTPGLVDAVRQSNVSICQRAGVGRAGDPRAAGVPAEDRRGSVLGEPLRMPNIATWWCGQASEREVVKANARSMFIGEALSRALPFDVGSAAGLTADLGSLGDVELSDWIDAQGQGSGGAGTVTLSTTPTVGRTACCHAR